MTRLESVRAMGYDCAVLATAGAGCRNPSILGASALLKALFLCVALPQWRAMQGHRKMGRVPSSRFTTPVSFATLLVVKDLANSNQLGVPS